MNSLNLEVKKVKNGLGIVAKKSFSQEDLVFEVKGKFISCFEDDVLDKRIRDNTFRFSKDWYLSPEGELGDYLNHSCSPNSYIKKVKNKLFIVPIKNIKEGEEVTIDYSTTIASDDSWKMKCKCGEKSCRKIIGQFILLPRSLQKRYINYEIVPRYIFK